MLVLVAFHDNHLIAKVLEAVRSLATTFPTVNHTVRRIPFQTRQVQCRHESILLRKPHCLYGFRTALLTEPPLIKHHNQITL